VSTLVVSQKCVVVEFTTIEFGQLKVARMLHTLICSVNFQIRRFCVSRRTSTFSRGLLQLMFENTPVATLLRPIGRQLTRTWIEPDPTCRLAPDLYFAV
jgi:hypothetical protein